MADDDPMSYMVENEDYETDDKIANKSRHKMRVSRRAMNT